MNTSRRKFRLFNCVALTMGLVLVLMCDGCASLTAKRRAEKEAQRTKAQAQSTAFQSAVGGNKRKISIQELDQLAYGYADRYFMMLSSAMDGIKRDNPNPAQRRLAQKLKRDGVMAINDIVSGNDPYSQTLDLVVSVTLQSIVLIDEDQAERHFGERAPGLIQAIRTLRVEVWDLAAKVLNQEQLELLDYLILEWRRTHPDIFQVAFVKFDNFAEAHAIGLLADFRTGRGFLAPLSEASQTLKDWGRLTERAFWYSKRMPSLAAIEAEAAVNEMLAAPEIVDLVKTADRIGETAQSLPQRMQDERKAIFAEVDARHAILTNTLADVRHILQDADGVGRTATALTTNLQQTLVVLGDTLKVSESVGRTFRMDEPSEKKFDIQDYANTLAQLNATITNAHRLMLSADDITRGPAWNKGIQAVTDLADRRLDRALRDLCVALAFAFVLALIFLLIAVRLVRRAVANAPPNQ